MNKVRLRTILVAGSAVLWAGGVAAGQISVLTYHYDNMRSGLDTNETILNRTNVNSGSFGKLFSYAVDGYVYAQPLYAAGLTMPGNVSRNVLFIATENNSVYAFDADTTANGAGGLYWHVNFGTAAATPTTDFGSRFGAYNNIVPEVGITSTPVIDPVGGVIYANAFIHENNTYFYQLHALNLTNGQDMPYSPVTLAATYPGTGVGGNGSVVTFVAKQQIQRTALTLAGGIVYVCFAGFADTDPYHGWILGYNATNLQLTANYIFNTTPNATVAEFGANAGEGGLWTSGGGMSVDANTNLFFETGNGSFDATNGSGGTDFGDTFMKLSTTNNGLQLADYFTPYNEAMLQTKDLDLGSCGLLLLPDQPGPHTHLMTGSGKQGWIYLIDRDQLTSDGNHFNSTTSNDFVVQVITNGLSGGAYDTAAYYNSGVYFAASGDSLRRFGVTNGVMSTNSISTSARTYASPGATPIITANGTNDGLAWALANVNPEVLVAYDATNLATELYNTTQAPGNRDKLANGVKFTLPIVVNGKAYTAGQSNVAVLGLLGGTLAFSAPAYTGQQYLSNAVITVNRVGPTAGAVSVSYATVAGGSAVAGVNYSNVSGTLNWAGGDGSLKTFNVPVINAGLATPNQTVNLVLTGPSGNTGISLPSSAVLTLLETPLGDWRQEHFGDNANNPAIAGDLADPAGDGIPNLLKYALGADPLTPGPNNPFTLETAGGSFGLTFNRNTAAADITYTVLYSDDLQTWFPFITYNAATGWVAQIGGAGASESAPVGTPPNQTVAATITDSAEAAARYFRLEVSH